MSDNYPQNPEHLEARIAALKAQLAKVESETAQTEHEIALTYDLIAASKKQMDAILDQLSALKRLNAVLQQEGLAYKEFHEAGLAVLALLDTKPLPQPPIQ